MTKLETLKLLIADSESKNQFDVSSIVSDIQVETTLLDQPGKLTFTLQAGLKETFFEGSNVTLQVGGLKVFDGYLFEKKLNEKLVLQCICYDRLRYLNNMDTYVFENKTVDEIFTTICTEQELPFKVVNGSSLATSSILHDNKSLYSMIQRAIDEVLVYTNKYLMVRDNAGVLELIDIEGLLSNILIGDESLLKGFNFTSSIDRDTYNYIKLVQENKEAQVRNKYIVMDGDNVGKWGRLQYFEKMDEDVNEAQIKEKAEQLLKLYNRKTKTLKMSCLGDFKLSAGVGVMVSIAGLATENVARMHAAFASRVSHKISKNKHEMEVDLEVV